MSSPSLTRRTAPKELSDELARGLEQGAGEVRSVTHRAVERLRRDDVPAQFGRFVLVGGVSSLLYAIVFILCTSLGDLSANLIGSALSSILANEMHRRLTFHADERVTWLTAQWEAGAVSLFGLLATSAALGWLHATASSAAPALQIALVVAVTTLIGALRFIALRWIFRPQPRTAGPAS